MNEEKSQKRFFFYALIATILIFGFGLFLGTLLESSRVDTAERYYKESEIRIIDQIVQNQFIC